MALTLKPLHEQVMVITGASSGIGLATAHAAARQGAKLVLVARSEHTLKEVVQDIIAAGGSAIAVVADVADRKALIKAATQAVGTYGRIDTWVNNAGLTIYGKLWDVSEEDSRRLFDINFWGVVNGSLVALPHLRKQGGALINVGSEASDVVVPLQGYYAASKHAVKGFTDALRVELASEDAPVSVTLILPTVVDTPYPQHARNYMEREPRLPGPKIDPETVADAILNAAVNPTREDKVGAQAIVDTLVSKIAPRLADKLEEKTVSTQQSDEEPRHPEGTLYQPGEEGRIHGG